MTDEQFTTLLKAITDGFDRVNGRLRAVETEAAVLKDRSDRAERQSGIIGAVTGGISAGIVLAVEKLFGK